MLLVIGYATMLAVSAASTTQRPVTYHVTTGPAQSPPSVVPVINQCFREGRWYPAGSIINGGRSGDWCYGSYCDFDGKVKYWDDYNCPTPKKNNNDPPFPDALPGHMGTPTVQQEPSPTQKQPVSSPSPPTTTTTPQTTTTRRPLFTFPSSSFNHTGCWFRWRYYLPGSDIMNGHRGRNCYGVYCDYNSRVVDWEDNCHMYNTATEDWT